MQKEQKIIVILGPTASGKTKFAARLANLLESEIISADSRQVYKDMNIGTGKDYPDYIVNNRKIPTHLIDIVDAGFEYDLSFFIRDFNEAYQKIINKGIIPILCGGSGMYIEAVLKGYELPLIPINHALRNELETINHETLKEKYFKLARHEYTAAADLSTPKRTVRAIEISTYLKSHSLINFKKAPLTPLIFGLNPSVEIRRNLIEQRLMTRIEEGLLGEVETLLKTIPHEKLIRYGLEYKYVTEHLMGTITKEEMTTLLTIAIQQFAKRQMTYFRKMEKSGLKINWIGSDELEMVKIKSLEFIT